MRHDYRSTNDDKLAIRTKSRGNPILLGTILVILSAVYLFILSSTVSQLHSMYDETSRRVAATSIPVVQAVHLGNGSSAIMMMKSDPFRQHSRWMYVSSTHPLPEGYTPSDLVASELPAAGEAQMKIAASIKPALTKLFAAAKRDDVRLVISSAYRSEEQQAKIFQEYVHTHGLTTAKQYVANPGESEHATGLAVDINTYSDACDTDETVCAITAQTADWLEKNSATYGFILRYPDGKEAQTGVSYEPWHIRYVGEGAASLMTADVTLDEFVGKVDPSLIR